MSALGRLLSRRTATRADSISQEEFAALLAGKQKGGAGDVGTQRALGLAAWYSGVRYLAESLAYLPVKAFRGDPADGNQRVLPQWLRVPWADENGRPLMTRGRLLELWMWSLLHRGNAFGWKTRDVMGRVIGVRYLHPDRVRVDIEDGKKVFRVDTSGLGHWRTFTTTEIFHLVGIGDDGLVGLSPIAVHAKNLGIAVAADEFAGKYFENGALLTSYIQLTKDTRKPIEEIKAEFEDFYTGIENANSSGVLSSNAEFKTVTLNAREAQILEARQWSVLEIARILRVPPHKIYDLSRATFANIEQQAIEGVQDGPRVWAERFEEQISADPDLLPANASIQFNLAALLRGDSISESQIIHSGIYDGYLSLADARKIRGLDEAPGMDVVYRPANVHVVDIATGEVIIPAGAPSEEVEDVSDSDDDDFNQTPEDPPVGSDPIGGPEGTEDRSKAAGTPAGNGSEPIITNDELSELVGGSR